MALLEKNRFIEELIHRCCFIHDRRSFVDSLLKPIKELIPAEGIAVTGVLRFGCDPRSIHFGYPPLYLMDHANTNHKVTPYFEKHLMECRRRGYATFKLSDFKDREHYLEEYKKRYINYGIKDGIQTTMLDSKGAIMGFWGCMTRSEENFTDEHKTLVDTIAPYVFYAYRKYKWLLNIDFFTMQSPEELIFGVVTTTNDGAITYMNTSARQLYEKNKGTVATQLPDCLHSALTKFKNDCRCAGEVSLAFREIETTCPFGTVVCFNFDKHGLTYLPVDGEGVAFIIDTKNVGTVLTELLTRREKEVIYCLVKGMTDKNIAKTLYISEKTVHAHVRNILKKLEASNRTEAANKAVKLGLA